MWLWLLSGCQACWNLKNQHSVGLSKVFPKTHLNDMKLRGLIGMMVRHGLNMLQGRVVKKTWVCVLANINLDYALGQEMDGFFVNLLCGHFINFLKRAIRMMYCH